MVWYTIKIFQLGSLLRLAESGVGAGDCMVRPGLAWRHRCVVSVVLVVLAKEKSFPILKSLCSVAFCCSCTHTIVYTHTHTHSNTQTHACTYPRSVISFVFAHCLRHSPFASRSQLWGRRRRWRWRRRRQHSRLHQRVLFLCNFAINSKTI